MRDQQLLKEHESASPAERDMMTLSLLVVPLFKMLKQSPKHRIYLAHPHTPSTQDSGKSH